MYGANNSEPPVKFSVMCPDRVYIWASIGLTVKKCRMFAENRTTHNTSEKGYVLRSLIWAVFPARTMTLK